MYRTFRRKLDFKNALTSGIREKWLNTWYILTYKYILVIKYRITTLQHTDRR